MHSKSLGRFRCSFPLYNLYSSRLQSQYPWILPCALLHRHSVHCAVWCQVLRKTACLYQLSMVSVWPSNHDCLRRTKPLPLVFHVASCFATGPCTAIKYRYWAICLHGVRSHTWDLARRKPPPPLFYRTLTNPQPRQGCHFKAAPTSCPPPPP